jgi:hypothetical protein
VTIPSVLNENVEPNTIYNYHCILSHNCFKNIKLCKVGMRHKTLHLLSETRCLLQSSRKVKLWACGVVRLVCYGLQFFEHSHENLFGVMFNIQLITLIFSSQTRIHSFHIMTFILKWRTCMMLSLFPKYGVISTRHCVSS